MTTTNIHFDCKHYKGTLPCTPHKEKGVHCDSCEDYSPVDARVLIIKLGAIGDVIRTTPLIRAYKKKFKNPKFTWVTLSPSILPEKEIDEILPLTVETTLYVQEVAFDIAINLDKEVEACALLNRVQAKEKYGFCLRDGVTQAVNPLALHKLTTGLFDDVSKQNTKSYCSEIFELCGMEFQGETYLLDAHKDKGYQWESIDRSKKVIGLNTGCGNRWTTRLWPEDKWISLTEYLVDNGYEVLLLGGQQEDEKNKRIAKQGRGKYFGHFPLPQFINLVDQCDLVVTQVTMGMHITIGLGKKIVLMNNIFNPYEFDLYGKGKLIGPEKECECFYKGTCVKGKSCMEDIAVEKVLETVEELI